MKKPTGNTRRRFLGATAAGAMGLSGGDLVQPARADPPAINEVPAAPGTLNVLSKRSVAAGSTGHLHLRFVPRTDLVDGARLWLFYDIRQGARVGQ